jgi:ABC-type spermidine/putrescine transport system permease subunit II
LQRRLPREVVRIREIRRPWVLAAVTCGYFAWSFFPLAVAVWVSLGWDPLTQQIQQIAPTLDAYRAALRDTELRGAFLHSTWLAVGTVAVALPLGTALGLTLAHLIRRPWRAVGATLLVMIAIPHVAFGVAFFYLFVFVIRIQLNTITQLAGHVTVALPFVALIVWTRMLLLEVSYEEQAADLGAPPRSTLTRVRSQC